MVKLESLKTALSRAEYEFQKNIFQWAIDNYKSIDHNCIVYLDYVMYADKDASAILNDAGDNCSNGFCIDNGLFHRDTTGRMHVPHVIRLLPVIKTRAYSHGYRGSYSISDNIIDFYNDADGNVCFDNFIRSSWCNSQNVSYQPNYNLYRQPVKLVFSNSINKEWNHTTQEDIDSVIDSHNNTKAQLDNAYKTSLTCLNRQEQDAYFTMQYRSTITPHIFRQALDLVGSGRIKSDMWGVIPSMSWLDDSYFASLGFTLPSFKYYNSLFCTVNKFLGVKPNHGIKKHLKLMPSVNADGSKEWSF
jgi:hypothetical protein